MKGSFKATLVALSVTNALCAPLAFAQETETKKEEQIEVIEVRGFGASLGKALREKRFSDSLVEVISSDDLGVLPDVSITDSLVRLPGIAAARDRGNASRISIRGMGPRLNIATMNNREIVSVEPSRDVRFEQFPAELIDSVQVYKSPVASRAEGGISGLVNMNFVSPLSKNGRKISVNGDVMHNSLGDDLPGTNGNGHKLSVGYIDQFSDTFGIALGLTYQDQPTLGRGVTTWDYNSDEYRGDLNENGIVEDAPWGVVGKTKIGYNKRTGALATLEWQPNERLSIKGDVFFSQFDIEERDDHLGLGKLGNYNNGDKWLYDASAIEPTIVATPDGFEKVVAGSQAGDQLNNYPLNVAVPLWDQTNQMLSTGLNMIYVGDTWKVTTDVGYSQASIESVWVRINPSYVGGAYDLGFDFTNGVPEIIEHSGDVSSIDSYALAGESTVWNETSPGVWEPSQQLSPATMDGIDDRELTDEMVSVNLDLERNVEWGIFEILRFGARYTDRTKENDQLNTWTRTASLDHGLTDYEMTYDIGGDYNIPDLYRYKNWKEVANVAFGGYDNPSDRSNKNQLASWELKETNSAAYVMLDISGEIGSIPFTGNVGLRYAKTEVESIGHEQDSIWTQDADGNWLLPIVPIVVHHDYDEWLPSLNLIFNITNDSLIRFGLARTMARPPLLEMRTGFAIDTISLPPTASGGNPTLDPYVANQADLGYEYYWGDNSAATINFFYKDLKSHIGLASDTVNFEGTEYAFTGPVNGEGGKIKGFELLYQQSFDMLPEPFNGLGIFANYSYTDSTAMEFKPVDNPYNLGGLSRDVASLTLWYEYNAFDARVSYNYRSEYTFINSWIPSQVKLYDSVNTLEASIGYKVTDKLRLTLQAQNLTDELSVSYWDNDKSKPADTLEWGRRILAGFQYNF